jgi:hypothetical protein
MIGLNVKGLLFHKTEDFQWGAKYSSSLEETLKKQKHSLIHSCREAADALSSNE